MSEDRNAPFTPRETRLIGLFFMLALALRVGLALQPVEFNDRIFVPDDTYYTLSIARSLASGAAPSTDGVTATNGFQPLLAFLEVPIFWISDTPDVGLRGALLLSALCGALAVGLIGVLLLRLSGFAAALTGMTCALISPFLLRNDLNGLETSLAGLLALMILIATLRVEAEPTHRTRIVLGLLCGAALLARVDMVFLVGLIGVLGLTRWGWRSVAVVGISACAVVAPWWGYSLLHFGSVVPASGAAVHEIVEFHRALYLTWVHELDYALNALALWFPADALVGTGALSLLLGLVVVGMLVAFGLRALDPGPGRDVLRMAALTALLHWLFYGFYLPAFWFHGRYFHFIALVFCLFAGLVAGQIIAADTSDDEVKRSASRWPASVAAVAALIYLAGGLLGSAAFFARPEATLDTGVRGAKGYRDVALELGERIPAGATVAAMQSGALEYFSEGRFAVINLDGVVNPDAHAALQSRSLQVFLRDRGVTHFADWDVNVKMLGRYFGPRFDLRCLDPVAEARAQGLHRFVAYRIDACLAEPDVPAS
jgi:hypothetical protein